MFRYFGYHFELMNTRDTIVLYPQEKESLVLGVCLGTGGRHDESAVETNSFLFFSFLASCYQTPYCICWNQPHLIPLYPFASY
jgi:hypothetical protein